MKMASPSVALADCETLIFADELREAQSFARRELAHTGQPRKAAIAAIVGEVFRDERGVHRSGYASAPTAFGGRRWHFRCGGCSHRVQRLYRPCGADEWGCRTCVGLRRLRRTRWTWGGAFWPLVKEIDAFTGRPGRRPKRYHRAVRDVAATITAAKLLLG